MDYFNDLLTTFLGLELVVALLSIEGQNAFRFQQTYLNFSSEDELKVLRVWNNMSN